VQAAEEAAEMTDTIDANPEAQNATTSSVGWGASMRVHTQGRSSSNDENTLGRSSEMVALEGLLNEVRYLVKTEPPTDVDGYAIQESAKPISLSEMEGFTIQESFQPMSNPLSANHQRTSSTNSKQELEVAKMAFPAKLEYVVNQNYDCLQRCGKDGFRVLDHDKFEQCVLQKFFKNLQGPEEPTAYGSVKRELIAHGFTQLHQGPRKNAFRHKDFIIGNSKRIRKIERVQMEHFENAIPQSGTKRPLPVGEPKVKVEQFWDDEGSYECSICYNSVRNCR
jgi:hypothetical protein